VDRRHNRRLYLRPRRWEIQIRHNGELRSRAECTIRHDPCRPAPVPYCPVNAKVCLGTASLVGTGSIVKAQTDTARSRQVDGYEGTAEEMAFVDMNEQQGGHIERLALGHE
jgi:hypothetical protein